MSAGVIYPSYGRDVVWSPALNAWDANYPVTNLSNLDELEVVARASGGLEMHVSGVLPAAKTISAFALLGHTIQEDASNFQIWAFSGVGNDPVADAATMVYDSGALNYWPPGSAPVLDYRAVRPVLLPAPVIARSFRIKMNPGAGYIELGGVEIGEAWIWPGVSFGRELGIDASERDIALVGGGSMPGDAGNARVLNGQVDLMKMSETATRGLDFQHGLQMATAFVFAQNFEDASTWARQCLYVRNKELPEMTGQLYRHDAFPVRLIEEMR